MQNRFHIEIANEEKKLNVPSQVFQTKINSEAHAIIFNELHEHNANSRKCTLSSVKLVFKLSLTRLINFTSVIVNAP